MTDPKDNESFFRKVVRFVANPATDWNELNTRQPADSSLELEKSELKAMIERKRRNDFVRKREFDMLRKLRREGLSPDQLAALGSTPDLDDSERQPEPSLRADSTVKAKIDEIEQQMTDEGFSPSSSRSPTEFFGKRTAPGSLPAADMSPQSARRGAEHEQEAFDGDDEQLPALPPLPADDAFEGSAGAQGEVRSEAAAQSPSPSAPDPLPTSTAIEAAAHGAPSDPGSIEWTTTAPTELVEPTQASQPTAPASMANLDDFSLDFGPETTPEGNPAPAASPIADTLSMAPTVPAALGASSSQAPTPADVHGAASASMAHMLPTRAERQPARPALPTLPAAPGSSREVGTSGVVTPGRTAGLSMGADVGMSVEVTEAVHDADLDEAVIAFANADFDQCEHLLTDLINPNGRRRDHAETWLVLFDLFRATGQQAKFETLSLEYAHRFGASAPQWFSLPRLVAQAAAASSQPSASLPRVGDVGWAAPAVLETESVAKLRARCLQLPLPWVFDWSGLRLLEPQAASQLATVFRQWSTEAVSMQWLDGERLLEVLAEIAPTGMKDADPAFWLLRLEALRLANRPAAFDEAAIDYCMTYEVSPPSWTKSRCLVRIRGGGNTTMSSTLSVLPEPTTGFAESSLYDDMGTTVAAVELCGQMVGDISPTLSKLDQDIGAASIVHVSCALLIRLDFIAAGDLFNWVQAKRAQNRTVMFEDTHRLSALFFVAMGITEHARVRLRAA